MFLKYNLFTIIWAIIVAVITLLPGSQMPKVSFSDMIAHGVVFIVLIILTIVGFTKQTLYPNIRFNATKIALIVCITYGILLESIQAVIPARYFELSDLVANTGGCLIGAMIFYIVYKL